METALRGWGRRQRSENIIWCFIISVEPIFKGAPVSACSQRASTEMHTPLHWAGKADFANMLPFFLWTDQEPWQVSHHKSAGRKMCLREYIVPSNIWLMKSKDTCLRVIVHNSLGLRHGGCFPSNCALFCNGRCAHVQLIMFFLKKNNPSMFNRITVNGATWCSECFLWRIHPIAALGNHARCHQVGLEGQKSGADIWGPA